jgi:hypothetical protein
LSSRRSRSQGRGIQSTKPKKWWENPEGMHLTVLPDIDMENTLVTKLEIKKAIFDINNWHKGCYKARIATDGTGITVTEPVQVGLRMDVPTAVDDSDTYGQRPCNYL